jgi:hypothetical protein
MTRRTLARRLVGIPWPPLLAVALVAFVGMAFVVRRNIPPRESDGTRALTILVSGDTNGLLFPYGCVPHYPGGLARRGEIVRQARAEGPVIYAELGNAPAGDSAYDRLKLAAILSGEMAMGVAAHNLGPAEVRLGTAELQRLASELKAPFVSTNVRDAQGRLLAEPLRVVELAGRRVAVAGLLSPHYASETTKVLDPADALAEVLAEHAPRYDSLLVLAYLPADELVQLASRLPARAMLVGPSSSEAAAATADVAGRVGREGRSLVRFDVAVDGEQAWRARDVIVSAVLAENSRQLDILEAYHRELAKHDFAPTATGLAMPISSGVSPAQRVAGTHTCRACHTSECAKWDGSRHERAWQSLVDRGVHFDAACQRCHTTGYGWEGGFSSAKAGRGVGAVGCESCHGPSLAHEQNPAVRTPFVASQQCANCHTAEIDPGFDYAAAWARIQHGPLPGNRSDATGVQGRQGALD